MAYSWDTEMVGDINQRQKATAFHETDFLKGYVKTQANHTYSATPKLDDYLTLRLREGTNKKCSRCQEASNTEVCNACRYKSANFEPAANTSYTRTGTYAIASKLSLYNPATSFTVDWYSPKRNPYKNPYQKEERYV